MCGFCLAVCVPWREGLAPPACHVRTTLIQTCHPERSRSFGEESVSEPSLIMRAVGEVGISSGILICLYIKCYFNNERYRSLKGDPAATSSRAFARSPMGSTRKSSTRLRSLRMTRLTVCWLVCVFIQTRYFISCSRFSNKGD